MENLKNKISRIIKEVLSKKIVSPAEKLKRKRYYQKHKKQIQEKAKKWRAKNPAKVKRYQKNQKIKKLRKSPPKLYKPRQIIKSV